MSRLFGNRTLSIIICLVGFQLGYAQNLVLNPSFESVNAGSLLCSWYISQAEFNSAINSWTCPTGGSSDIFSSTLGAGCFCSTQSTAAANVGQQAPRTGNTHAAIYVYGSGGCTPYREYLQGRLCMPLNVGETYQVEMYVSLTDHSTRGARNIEVKFSNTPVNVSSMCVYNATPDLSYTGAVITDKAGWSLVSFTYTPTVAGQQYFMIGNFSNDASTTTAPATGGNENYVRYFVDDVSVASVTTSSGNPGTNGTASLCVGAPSVNLFSYLGGSPDNNGTWIGPSALSGGYLGSFDPAVHAAGVYTYSISTAPTGCGSASTATAQVTVAFNGSANATITQPANLCLNAASSQLAAASPGGTWSASCGPCISAGGLFDPSIAGVGVHTVFYSISGACAAADTITLGVNGLPVINAGNDISVCAGEGAVLTASGASGYVWSPATGLSDTTSVSVNASPTNTVTYTVTGTDANGCVGSDNVTVSVMAPPIINLGSGVSICMGDSAQLTASGASTYAWSPMTGVTNANFNNSVITSAPQGNILYTVTGTDANGCEGVGQVAVTVRNNPQVAFSVLPPVGCVPLTVNFSYTGDPVNTYDWDFGNGTQQNIAAPSVIYTQAGTYSVSLTATDAFGCSTTLIQADLVNAYPFPEAGMIANPYQIWQDNAIVTVADGSISTSFWQYVISDGSTYSTPNFTHQFVDTGHYHIIQVVTSVVGCSDTAFVEVRVNPVTTVYIPNAFTPGNIDNLNNTFKVYGNVIDDFELYIFNRWGEKLFTSKDQNVGWDGTTKNGKLCKQDVYVYKISYTDHRKEQNTLSGSVTLVR